MADEPVITYDEPAVLWRLTRGRDRARAMIIPGVPESTLVYFLNDQFESGQNVKDWKSAIEAAELLKRQLLDEGWKEE